MRGRRWIRPLTLLAVAVGGVVVALTVGIPPIDEVRAAVAAAGWAGPVLYTALYAALTLTPAPASILSITAGVLFGLPVGLVVVMVGALAGSTVGFAVARTLGRGSVQRVDSDRLRRLDALLRRSGLLAVIGVRLVPTLPFAAVNLLLGLSAVRSRDYLVGTAVGILPGGTAFVTMGTFGADPGSMPFLLALGGIVTLAVVSAVVVRRRSATVDIERG